MKQSLNKLFLIWPCGSKRHDGRDSFSSSSLLISSCYADYCFIIMSHNVAINKQTQQTVLSQKSPPQIILLFCFRAHSIQNILNAASKKLIDRWCDSLKIAALLIIQSHRHLFKLTGGKTNIKNVHYIKVTNRTMAINFTGSNIITRNTDSRHATATTHTFKAFLPHGFLLEQN